MKLTIQEIAEVAHEVNRALCQAFGDDSQLPWLETTLENKDASITQVEFTLANPDATPEDQHNEWMRNKLAKVKIDLKLLADLRARRGVYSAAQQAQIAGGVGGDAQGGRAGRKAGKVGGKAAFQKRDLVMVADQTQAGFGCHRRRAPADKKGSSDLLQCLDPLADCRRGDMQVCRRKIERAAPVDGGKGGKLGGIKH